MESCSLIFWHPNRVMKIKIEKIVFVLKRKVILISHQILG